MPSYYPAFLDVRKRKCVVFGGGEIAEQKVKFLLECEANLTVFSPEVTTSLEALAQEGRIAWEKRKFITGDLLGAFLAIVADTSDSRINKSVAAEAEQMNVVLNVVDVTHLCTFIAPAVVKRGDITIAISTGGASPALARKFREELSQNSILKYADLAPLLSWARMEIRKQGIQVHPDQWQRCLTDDLVNLVQQDQMEQARDVLMVGLTEGAVTTSA